MLKIARAAILILTVTVPAWSQTGDSPAVPPRPRVISVPTPEKKPARKPVRRKATPTPAPAAPAPAPAAATPSTPAPAPTVAPMIKQPPVAAKPAAATPAPRRRTTRTAEVATSYMPKVKAAFSVRWNEVIAPLMKDFSPGNVSVVFLLDAEGAVTNFKITQNTSNEAFGKFCEQFVRETPFEKPPEKALTDGQLEVPFTFWIY
jgi:TonB family protein